MLHEEEKHWFDLLFWPLIIGIAVGIIIIFSFFKVYGSDENIPNIRPFDDSFYQVIVSGRFGDNRIHTMGGWKYPHSGVDYKLERGTPLWATADGIIVKAEDLGKYGYGNAVVIDHGRYQTVYAHLSEFKLLKGAHVKRFEVIGFVGDSGNAIGNHAHYEVRDNNVPIPPSVLIFKNKKE